MVRLPDIPVGTWLSDQASRFADATAGYFPALEFEDGAKQAESIIPPDYPLPGGQDQWQAAEQQRIEDELRRAQQEEEERKRQQEQADLARREQELRAQQVADEQRAQDQGQQATSWAQRLGIPTPDEAFSGFSNLANRPTDNLSSTGSFESPAPEDYSTPSSASQSPVDQFTSWAQGLTAPLFREHTYADSVREAQDRPPEPARPAPSTTGILDTLGSTAETLGNVATGAGRALYEGGKAAVEEWQQPAALGQTGLPPDVLGPMTRGAGVVRKAGEAAVDSALRSASGGLGASAEPYHYGTIPETVPAQVPGIGGRTIPLVGGQDVDFSQQDVVAGVGSQVLDPINYLGVPAAVKAGRLAPELIRSLPGVGETELLFQGGRGLVRRAGEALARPIGSEVQQVGSGVVPEQGKRIPMGAANAAQGAVFGAASENLQAQQEGRDVDYGEQARRALIGGVLGYGAGRFGPAGARALGQDVRRLGSGVTPNPPGTPPGVGRAADLAGTHADARKLGEAYDRVESGAYRRQPDETDIKQIITTADKMRGEVTDRHAELAAVVRHAGSLLPPGQKLTSKERIDLLALNYPGNEDVSKAVMERVIEPEMRRLSPADYKELNIVMTQLDNADMDAAVRRTTQNQGLGVEVEGKPGIETVRMDAEARLERKRAQAQHRLARKEHGAAIKERDELLAIIRATGEGPTHGVETDYQAFQRGFRGFGPPRRMETPRSEAAEARFAKAQERVAKADADIVAAQARIAKSTERSRLRRIDQQTRRAATRAEEVGTSRQYSGGATPQEVENIEAALKERVGAERYEKIVAARGALYDFRDMMRERLLESEVWDQDLYDVLKQNFPHYSPVRILKYLDESHLDNAVQQGGRSFSVADNGVKALTKQGTTAERMTPVEAIYQMGFQSERLAQRNAIMRQLAEWSENPQMHAIVQPLSGETDAPLGFERVSAFVDGQKQSLAVADDLMPALNLGQPGALGAAGAVLRAAKTPLEVGTTRGNPAFIMMNTLNDYLWTMTRYALESKGGPKGVGGLVNPWERMKDFKDVTQGYLTAFRELPQNAKPVVGMAVGATTEAVHDWEDHEDDPYYWYKVIAAGGAGAALARTRLGTLSKDEAAMIQRFRESGASIGGARGRFSGTKDLAREMLGEHPIIRTVEDASGMKKLIQWDQYRRLGDILGLAWTRPLGVLGSAAELGPRYATFRRGERAAGDSLGQRMQAAKQAAEAAGQKFTSVDADVVRQQYIITRADPEIVRAAREITADFDKGGRTVKQANNLLPFLNAATQATASGADLIWKNKTKSAVVSTALVGGLISLDAYNRSVSPEDYANVSAVTKNTGAFILSDKEPEAGGKRGLVYIPLRGWLGALVPVTRAAMDQVYGTDTRRWDQIATDTVRATVGNLSPVNADMSVIANLATPPGSTMLQLMANYDYFRDQPIVSRSMAGLPTSEQFDTRTSLMARQLGRMDLPGVGQASPMKWDWFFRNISPGPSAAFMGAVDVALRKSGYDLPAVEKDVPTGARDIPLAGGVLGRVLRTVGSEQENRAYELASDIMARHSNTMVDYVKSSPAYQAATPDRRTQMLRSAEQAMIEQANTLAGVDQFKQPKNLGLPQRFEGVQAGSRLEGEVGSALAKSRKNQSARERFLVQQYGRRETRAWKKLHTAQDLESQQLRSAVRTLVRE